MATRVMVSGSVPATSGSTMRPCTASPARPTSCSTSRVASTMPRSCARCAGRLYVDMDPGYTQIWQEGYGVDMNVRGHDAWDAGAYAWLRPRPPDALIGDAWLLFDVPAGGG